MAWRVKIDGLPFAPLSPKEVSSLELPFREDEVFTALNEMDGDKAPGLDGFSMHYGTPLGILSKAKSWRCLGNFMLMRLLLKV